MRVLLAGASGAIGSALIPRLIAADHEVVMITRRAGSFAGTGVSEVVADLARRSKTLSALDGYSADAVIDLLGSNIFLPTTHRGMRRINRLRIEGTSTLLAVARKVGARRFVAASPFYGYGFCDHGGAVRDESAPFGQPDGTANDDVQLGVLGREQQVRAFGGIVLRYGLPYAPGAASVPAVPRHWSGSIPLVHAEDAANAAFLALEGGVPGTSYNIVDNAFTTWRELQQVQARADGFRPPIALGESFIELIAPFPAQLILKTSLRLSNQKAQRELGWSPVYPSLRVGLLSANTTCAA